MNKTGIVFSNNQRSACVVRYDHGLSIELIHESDYGKVTKVWIVLDAAQEKDLVEFMNNTST
jgi:hypothetical protein